METNTPSPSQLGTKNTNCYGIDPGTCLAWRCSSNRFLISVSQSTPATLRWHFQRSLVYVSRALCDPCFRCCEYTQRSERRFVFLRRCSTLEKRPNCKLTSSFVSPWNGARTTSPESHCCGSPYNGVYIQSQSVPYGCTTLRPTASSR